MATPLRSTARARTRHTEPKPVTLWLMSRPRRPCATASCQEAEATRAIGLQLEANATRLKSDPLPSGRPPTLKRRTVQFLFDPTSGETRWLHAFGLQDELDSVAQSCPTSHLTDASGADGADRAMVSPTGRIAPIGPLAQTPRRSPNPPEAEELVAMLLASGWTWREANERSAH